MMTTTHNVRELLNDLGYTSGDHDADVRAALEAMTRASALRSQHDDALTRAVEEQGATVLLSERIPDGPMTAPCSVVLARRDDEWMTWLFNHQSGGLFYGHYFPFRDHEPLKERHAVEAAAYADYFVRRAKDFRYEYDLPITPLAQSAK